MYMGGVRVARRRGKPKGAPTSKPYHFQAPTGGWVTNENLAGQRPNTATVLDNWFCTERSIKGRAGSTKVATIGSNSVTALFAYYGAASSQNKFFAADASAIFEISGFDPDTAPSASVSSLSGGDWSTVQMTTSGGNYLICANGADTMRTFDGSSWASSGITFSGSYSGVTTADIAFVFKHKSRLYLVEKDSSRVFFLPIDSISANIGTDSGTGALELGAIFQNGGKVLFGATWSLDAGDGVDDKWVAVSSLGEVAIYEGDDPSSSSAWALVGRYDISTPLGPQAIMQAGGDLLVATYEGLVPISQAINRDIAALSLGAISYPIEPNWRAQVQVSSPSSPWQVLKWPRENMALVSLPHSAENEQFVVNLKTGAWSRYTGWAMTKMELFEGLAYYADASGSIFQAESGGSDGADSDNILHQCRIAWSPLRSPVNHKQVDLARAIFLGNAAFTPKLSVGADYDNDFPAPPAAVSNAEPTTAVWDSAVWDDSLWDVTTDVSGDLITVKTRWRSVAANGTFMAPEIQVHTGGARKPDFELVQFDVMYKEGAPVV